MAEKTRYRRISNGHWDFLQYEKEIRGLFGKKKRWYYVLRPYYDTFHGREESIRDEGYINSLNTNLNDFVKRWECIDDYVEYYGKEQARLVQKAIDYKNEIEKKKGTVKNM